MSSVELPEFHSGSLSYTASFAEPAFELAHAGPMLQRHVFRALRDFDVDLAGMQEVAMPIGPGNWNLSVSFLAFKASLKVQVSDLQVTFIHELMHEAMLVKKVLHAIEHAITQAAPGIGLSQRQLLQQIHCKMTRVDIEERIPAYSGGLQEDLGEPTGRGIGLYFTSDLFSGQAGVVLDKSAVLDEGLFVQVRCSFDADAFDLITSCDNFQTYLARIDRAFRLQGTLGRTA